MFRNKDIFVHLKKLSKIPLSSSGFLVPVSELTYTAFYNPKPLFTPEEKPAAAKLIEECLPQINKGFVYFCKGMIPDRRQDAQISLSGLQYMIDEFKDDQKVYGKLKPIFDAPGVTCLERSIFFHTGIPNDYIEDLEMDLSKIPSSHFWWFFTEDHDENNQ